MSKKILFYSAVFLCVIACSNDNNEIQEPEIPFGGKDPDSVGFWNEAELLWSDEFDGTTISNDNWFLESGAGGWGTGELQNYRSSGNTEVSNGTLKVITKKNINSALEGDYTSARLTGKKNIKYGQFEVRAKLPIHKGKGLFPAIWLLGSNIKTVGWPNCGEIDIMKYLSYLPNRVQFAAHSEANNNSNGSEIGVVVDLETIEEEFHIYGLLWTTKYLKFYIDDINNVQFVYRRPANFNDVNWPFQNDFYLILNMAVGGKWGGFDGVDTDIYPAIMEIDYVRVYQVK